MFITRDNIRLGQPIFYCVKAKNGSYIHRAVVTDFYYHCFKFTDLDANKADMKGFYSLFPECDSSVFCTTEIEAQKWLNS